MAQQIAQKSEVVVVPAGDKFLRWFAPEGRTYFIQASDPNDPLQTWIWTSCIESANNLEISHEIGGTADKAFFRLHYTDQQPPSGVSLEDWDADGDGLSNALELQLQTNPLDPDTSGDGIPDGWAYVHGFNPLANNAAGMFQGGIVTNLEAFQSGVQAHPAATLSDLDGDGVPNDSDASPEDNSIDWQRAGDARYALIEVDAPAEAGAPQDLNDKCDVLFLNGIWADGAWIGKQAVPLAGSHPTEDPQVDQHYETSFTGWHSLNSQRSIMGWAEIKFTAGPNGGDGPYSAGSWIAGQSVRNLSDGVPFHAYAGSNFQPLGIDKAGRTFARMTYVTGGAPPVSHSRIAAFGEEGTLLSLLSAPGGYHPTGSSGHSDASDSGWLASNSSNSLSVPSSHRLAVWNDQLGEVSMPVQADGWFYPLHLAELQDGRAILAAGVISGQETKVFLQDGHGAMKHMPSLSGHKIRLFAGDGTGITSDGKLWRNGIMIPLADLCDEYSELEEDGWQFRPLRSNSGGVYLIQADHAAEGEKAFLKLPVDIQVTKEGDAVAPEAGLIVKKGDSVRYRLSPGLPDDPVLFEDKIQWHWRILQANGIWGNWTAYQNGKGHTFAAQPATAGIYEVKATVNGRDSFLKRQKDDPHSPRVKDENDCFGVVDDDWQIVVVNQARSSLGSEAYATAAANPPFGAQDPKCNLFVAHKATDGGATVPWINGYPLRRRPPTANQWQGTDPKPIPNWTLLPEQTYPQPGFIVARLGLNHGHVGILDYDGAWISAGSINVNRKAHLINEISLRSDRVIYQPARLRKYTP
jgi:hypothetical protein